MQVTITGGTGLIGRALARRLREAGDPVRVTGRRRPRELDSEVNFWAWDVTAGAPPPECLEGSDAVVHLAGESVAQRWTAEVKERIRASRVQGTRRLVDSLGRMAKKPEVLVAASAVGVYGDRGDEWLSETSAPGEGFLAEVARQWEQEAEGAEAYGVRVVRLRLGIVLARDGGALARMLPLFRYGLGGVLGTGRQWMSWIHLEDVVELIRFAMHQTRLRGAVNAVAPNPVSNAEFTRTLASLVHMPALFRVPAFAMRLAYGEMAGMLLGGQRVRPEAALSAGFAFRWSELRPALEDLLARRR